MEPLLEKHCLQVQEDAGEILSQMGEILESVSDVRVVICGEKERRFGSVVVKC